MRLHHYALVVVATTYILLLIGGTVNPTGSSLACPDWPLCYGQVFPEMTNGVEYEHTHRMAGTLVGFLTMGLAFGLWFRRRKDKNLGRLGLLLFGMVIAQGVLGGVTVLLKLPLIVSAAHLMLSMFFFLALIYTVFRIKAGPATATDPPPLKRGLVLITGLLVYLQIFLGGLVRHTKAGQVCGSDWVTCGGSFWPAIGAQQLHMFHRFVGVFLAIMVVVVAVLAAREAKKHGRTLAYVAALSAPFITALQVLLGILTVSTHIGLVEVTLHLGVGALLLANFGVVYLGLGPMTARAIAAEQGHREQTLVPLSETSI